MDKKALLQKIKKFLPKMVVLLAAVIVLLGNVNAKQGYHMDELLSFELANGEFNPWIVPTQPKGRLAKFVENELRGETFGETVDNFVDTIKDVLANKGASKLLSYKADVYEEPVWIDAHTFEEYITVGEQDGFSYLSVYFNVKDDNHPPLHFMTLHTISSLFPGEIAPVMGCIINLFCVLGVMVLLMRLGAQVMKLWNAEKWGEFAGLLAAALYGLSVGAVSTTLLIRMYAMITFFCVATLALHVRKLYNDKLGGSDFTGKNKLLITVTVLGFWTQYFFLFYCLILAAVTAVSLWREKRTKELTCYIRSMVTAAVLGVAIFPFAISDVFSSGRGVEALENLSAGLSGYGSRIWAFACILATELGVSILILAVIGLIGIVVAIRKKQLGLLGLLWIPVAGYFLMAARMSPYLVNRYVMPLFPLLTLNVVVAFCKGMTFLERRKNGQKTVGIVAMVLAVLSLIGQVIYVSSHESDYLYIGYEKQKSVSEAYRDYPCICVYEGVGYYENLQEFTDYEKTLLVTVPELANRQETGSVEALEQVVVLVKGGLDVEPVVTLLQESYGLYPSMTLLEGNAPYGDTIYLFERK